MSNSDVITHLLMNSARIRRAIRRISYQIFEDTGGGENLIIFGIENRGFILAQKIAEELTKISQIPIPAQEIFVKDELKNAFDPDPANPLPDNRKKEIGERIYTPYVQGKKVIIVDDVIYSGETIFKALQKITLNNQPQEIRLAALIDRGHRRYPINIQYLGLFCPTKLKEHVRCGFSNDGEPEGVWLDSSFSRSAKK